MEGTSSDASCEALHRLDAMAGRAGLVVGIETLPDCADLIWLEENGLEHVGVTLDVGHMVLGGGALLRPYGTVGGMVRHLGDRMVNVHVHDVDGTHDHVELGSGEVDLCDLLRSAADVGYVGMFCLELNPDRVSPAGILRSRDLLQAQMARLAHRSLGSHQAGLDRED